MSGWRDLRIVAVLFTCGGPLAAQTEPDWHLDAPIWSGEIVHAESVIPLQFGDAGPITGRLAFPVEKLISVQAAGGQRSLQLGVDVSLGEDGQTLVFTPGPDLKFVKESQFYPEPNSPMSYRHRVNHPELWMLYSSGGWFHQLQWEVTYRKRATPWTGWTPKFAEQQLPRTIAKLRAGEPVTFGFSGDSITAGGDASALMDLKPQMPAYPALVTSMLQAKYKSEVTLKNRAVGGWSVANGVQDLDALLAEKPDLIVIAYGMNDVGRRNPEWFRDQTKTLVDRIQAANSDIEFVLVAPMIGNHEWVHTPREMFDTYRDELAGLTGPGVVLADLTAVWGELLKTKHDYDLIGNGLNHPNDFGHRLYAQAILGLLVPAGE